MEAIAGFMTHFPAYRIEHVLALKFHVFIELLAAGLAPAARAAADAEAGLPSVPSWPSDPLGAGTRSVTGGPELLTGMMVRGR